MFCVRSLLSLKYNLVMSPSQCYSSGFITAGTERTGNLRLDNHYVYVCLKKAYDTFTRNQLNSITSVQFSSVALLCPTLCDPMNCSMPVFPVPYQLLELTQTHVHWVGDAIQLSQPLLSPSPPTFSLSQHQGVFQRGSNTTYLTTYS